MREKFFAYLESGSAAEFEELRRLMLQREEYDPYSRDLSEMEEHLSQGQPDQARAVAQKSIANLILSPGFHMCQSELARLDGNEQAAAAEAAVAVRLIEGILSTGDGTVDAPYRVLRTSDEYDVLLYLQLTFVRQALVHHGSRRLDRITTQEGRDVLFDVTDCMDKLQRNLGAIGD